MFDFFILFVYLSFHKGTFFKAQVQLNLTLLFNFVTSTLYFNTYLSISLFYIFFITSFIFFVSHSSLFVYVYVYFLFFALKIFFVVKM